MSSYHIYAALHEEAKENWVWISSKQPLSGDHLRIRNPDTRKSVVAERRAIDQNFRNHYSSRRETIALPTSGQVVVMNAAHRTRLGIPQTQVDVQLEITEADGWYCRYIRASLDHPHPNVKTSVILAIVSISLGVIGLLLGMLSVILCFCGG